MTTNKIEKILTHFVGVYSVPSGCGVILHSCQILIVRFSFTEVCQCVLLCCIRCFSKFIYKLSILPIMFYFRQSAPLSRPVIGYKIRECYVFNVISDQPHTPTYLYQFLYLFLILGGTIKLATFEDFVVCRLFHFTPIKNVSILLIFIASKFNILFFENLFHTVITNMITVISAKPFSRLNPQKMCFQAVFIHAACFILR